MKLNVKLEGSAPLPAHAKPGDAGLDLTSRENVFIKPGETVTVSTGVRMEIPPGYFGLMAPRSGLATNYGITLANSPGIIDSQFRGVIAAPLRNEGDSGFEVFVGDRICQLIILKFETCECVEVESVGETERGESGFGSTGF